MFITRQLKVILMSKEIMKLPSKDMLQEVKMDKRSDHHHVNATSKYNMPTGIEQFDLNQPNYSRYTSSRIPIEQKQEIEEIVNRKMADNMVVFQKIVNLIRESQSASTRDTSDSTPLNIAAMVEHIARSLSNMDFVRELYYIYEDNKFDLIIIHKNEDNSYAFNTIFDKILEIEEHLSTYIEPLIMHESEVEPDYLIDTKVVFKR